MEEIERVVAGVMASPRYRDLCVRTVRRIAAEELARRGRLKEAVKATRARLHQIHGAYESPIDYERAWRDLQAAHAGGSPERIREGCRKILSLHASTRERVSILDRFYAAIWQRTGRPRVLLDLACGLNPLTLPWMELGRAIYHAYDIDARRLAFLGRYFALTVVEGHTHLQDLICDPPREQADVALLLKTSACLERQRKGSTLALLDALAVPYVVVTFPVRSLGGRDVGMPAHYERAFTEAISGRPWRVDMVRFESELAFIVDKR